MPGPAITVELSSGFISRVVVKWPALKSGLFFAIRSGFRAKIVRIQVVRRRKVRNIKWRIKDGTFVVTCAGSVCRGIVLEVVEREIALVNQEGATEFIGGSLYRVAFSQSQNRDR